MIDLIGRLPTHGKRSSSSRRMIFSEWLAAQLTENLPNHSRAIASKVSGDCVFSICLFAPGSTPRARRRRASSRRSRACRRETSG